MIKRAFNQIRKIVFVLILLYGINVLISPLNVILPINIYSVGLTTVLGIPGLISFTIIFLLI